MATLEGAVVVVTGAGRGIGSAIAEEMARGGAKVVVNYARSKGPAEELVQHLRELGSPQAVAIGADVAENICTECHLSREELDAFALESQQRAAHAVAAGIFRDEIVPVEVPGKKGPTLFEQEEGRPQRSGYGPDRGQRGVRGTVGGGGQGTRIRSLEAQRQRWCHCIGSSHWSQWHTCAGHPALRNAATERPLRSGDPVYRRGSGRGYDRRTLTIRDIEGIIKHEPLILCSGSSQYLDHVQLNDCPVQLAGRVWLPRGND